MYNISIYVYLLTEVGFSSDMSWCQRAQSYAISSFEVYLHNYSQ